MMELQYARSLLFLPASNARAVEKARSLPCDMVILDMEDAVPAGRKDEARAAALDALALGFGARLAAVRINAEHTPWHGRDMVALLHARADYVVLPKVETPGQVKDVASVCARPVIAMIESAAGVLAARAIAAEAATAALFMGNNDLRAGLRIPAGAGRQGLMLALQTVVLAARAAGKPVFDGVYNRLDDPAGLEAECADGHALGFDGKTLIHPAQIDIANRIFGPDPDAVEAAHRLVAAASGGAERFEGRMIEDMHVAEARSLLARAAACGMIG